MKHLLLAAALALPLGASDEAGHMIEKMKVTPIRSYIVAQVVNGQGEVVLDIEESLRAMAPYSSSYATVYRVASGDTYTLYQDRRTVPAEQYRARLVLPRGESIVL